MSLGRDGDQPPPLGGGKPRATPHPLVAIPPPLQGRSDASSGPRWAGRLVRKEEHLFDYFTVDYVLFFKKSRPHVHSPASPSQDPSCPVGHDNVFALDMLDRQETPPLPCYREAEPGKGGHEEISARI